MSDRHKVSIEQKREADRKSRLEFNESDSRRMSDKAGKKQNPQRSLLVIEQPVRRQKGQGNTLISQNKSNAKGTVVSSSNSSKRKESLFLEYQDLFQQQDKISISSSSSESDSSSFQRRARQQSIEFRYSRHKKEENSSEYDFITHTINSKMSMISKNLTHNSQRLSSPQEQIKKSIKEVQRKEAMMRGTQKELKGTQKDILRTEKSIKNQKSMNKIGSNNRIQFQSTVRLNRENSILSQDLVSQHSIQSGRQYTQQHIMRLLENSNINEEERQKYLQIIEELDKKIEEVEPQRKERFKRKIRQTFVSAFQQIQTGQQQRKDQDEVGSQYSVNQNDSILLSVPYRATNDRMIVRHPSNTTSIIENSFVNNKEQNERLRMFKENCFSCFQYDLDDEQYESQEFDSSVEEEQQQIDLLSQSQVEQSLSEPSKKDPTVVQFKLQDRKYQRKCLRDPYFDTYSLEWVSLQDYKWANREFFCYYDNLPFLTVRKLIIYITRYVNITAKRIINHNLFLLAVLASIIYNIVVFVQEQSNNSPSYRKDLRTSKQLVLYLFILENVLKLLGNGIVRFFRDAWNILDTMILVLFIINFYFDDILIADFTVIRLFRVLLFMGLFIRPLRVMLIALSKSIIFLIEALVIVFIFTYFFALVGLHLFYGLFRLKCHDEETGIVSNMMCGYDQICPDTQYCAYSFNNPQYPSSFDDFVYAYGQIIRVMIYNDWTDPVYFSMRTFHPATVIYYILIIFIAGIFGTNLIIAVLKIYYSSTQSQFQTQDDIQIQSDDVLNLMVLKSFGVDRDIKYLYEGTQIFSNTIDQQRTIDITTEKKKRKTFLKKRVRLLSARQARELDEKLVNDREYQKKGNHCFGELDCLSIENILSTNYINKLFWTKIKGNVDLQEDENKAEIMEKFEKNPFLSWRTRVKPNLESYVSNSEQDIFTDSKKEQMKKDRRKREFEFIRQMAMKQFYIIQQRDLDQQRRIKKKEMTYLTLRIKEKPKHSFPYHKKQRFKQFDVQCDTMRMKGPLTYRRNSQLQFDNYFVSKRKLDEYGDFASSPDSNFKMKKSHLIYLYGQEYDYPAIQTLINRKPNEPEEDNSIDIEDQYITFRMSEFKLNMIGKHNWSGDDVREQYNFQKKNYIFKSLNTSDIKIWLTGINYALVIQKYAIGLLKNKIVESLFDTIVLFNVLLLCLEGLVESNLVSNMNDIFTLFLVIEVIFKVISVGLVRFCYKFMNIFDTLVISCCLMEILLRMFLNSTASIYLSLMRAMQGILFYRVIKYNKFAVRMGEITKNTFPSFINLIILMLFVIMIFALLGMNIFKDKFPINSENGLLHSFLNVPKSFMAVFDRATGDDWYGLIIYGTTYSNPTLTMIYGIALVYVLIFMTFGLVLAIILDGFSNYSIDVEEDDQFQLKKIDKMNTEISESVKDRLEEGISLNTQRSQEETETEIDIQLEQTQHIFSATNLQKPEIIPFKQNKNLLDLQGNIDRLVDKMFRGFEFFNNEESEIALFMFSKDSLFRKFCYRLVKYRQYTLFMNLVIMISLINMAIYTFDQEEQLWIKWLEFGMNLLIAVDCILKIISFGFFHDHGAFTNEFWRTVDFFYLIAFFINQWHQFQAFYYISYIKYFRPMRFVNMFQQLNQLNNALAKSLKDLVNILIVQLMVWFIFAIFGVIIYKNKLGYCEFPLNFGINQQECINNGQEWINYVHNFDNIFNAISTLYVVCTGDGWGLTFQICYNANSSDIGPTFMGNVWITYIYFFLFQVIGSQFFMGFFTGILFVNFQTNRSLLSKEIFTQDQSLFLQVTQMILEENPNYSDPPNSFIRQLASKTINNKIYQKIMSPAIFINSIVLSLFYFEANINFLQALDKIYYGFSFLMIADTILKLLSYGPVRYWGYVWRKLELILSFTALVDFLLYITMQWTDEYFTSNIRQGYFIPVRLFFALRNFRSLLIIQEFKGLSRLLRVLQFSLPSLFQILIFYFAILFVYAYAGCELFGEIDKGSIIDDYLNFTTFPKAMLALFKCSTKNGWRFIMADCTYLNPYCDSDPKYCGKSWSVVILYFYSYVLISAYIVLLLFVTGLVEQFEKFYNSQNSVLQTYIENIDRFRTVWCKYSSENKGLKMHTKYLAHFLLELGEPLGSMKGDNIWDAAKSAANFKIKAINNYVNFQVVLYETVRYAYKQDIFHTGSPASIEAIKNIDKDTRFRLHFRRTSTQEKRQPVSGQIHLKGNFNILQEYLYVLIVLKTWESYTQKLLKKLGNNEIISGEISEHSNSSQEVQLNINEPQITRHNHTENSLEDFKEQQYVTSVPRYVAKRNKKHKLKFEDKQSEDVCYEPEDQVNPQSPNDNTLNIERSGKRLKSALKQQKFGFMEFEEPRYSIKKSHIPNPMIDEDSNQNASRANVNDSIVEQEDSAMLINSSKNRMMNLSQVSWRSEDVASESHNFLKVKKFDIHHWNKKKH